MKDNISPEEKLLKLIRGQKKQNNSVKKLPDAPAKETKTLKNKILSFPLQRYFEFLNINKIIFWVFVGSCLYLVFIFVYPLFMTKNIVLPDISQGKSTEEKSIILQEIKPYEYYTQGLKNRQIFSSASTGQESEKPLGTINADLIKDMSLVGIIAGDSPQAIIEDKKAQKTFYVTKGQFIGEFKVEEIQEGKIILKYNGQKFELYL